MDFQPRVRSTSERLREFHNKTLEAVATAQTRPRANTTHTCVTPTKEESAHGINVQSTPDGIPQCNNSSSYKPNLVFRDSSGYHAPLTIVNETMLTSGAQFHFSELKTGNADWEAFHLSDITSTTEARPSNHKTKHQ